MKIDTCVFCNFDLPLVDEVNYKELFREHLEHIKREEQTMKNNWKVEIDDILSKHYNDIFYGSIEYENQNDGVINFIESLLEEQKKELMEEAIAREKMLVDMHRIELDAISCMSLERFIKWSDDRKNKESLKHHE